jgi:hypothetical protein
MWFSRKKPAPAPEKSKTSSTTLGGYTTQPPVEVADGKGGKRLIVPTTDNYYMGHEGGKKKFHSSSDDLHPHTINPADLLPGGADILKNAKPGSHLTSRTFSKDGKMGHVRAVDGVPIQRSPMRPIAGTTPKKPDAPKR